MTPQKFKLRINEDNKCIECGTYHYHQEDIDEALDKQLTNIIEEIHTLKKEWGSDIHSPVVKSVLVNVELLIKEEFE